MTKSEFIDRVASKSGLSKKDATTAVDATLESIKDALRTGDDVVFTTWHTTVKAHDLRRDPRISLCVDDERPPFSFVLIEGTTRLSDNLDEVRAWATRIAGRYMGNMRAKAYGARNGVPGELLVRVTPTRVVAQAAIAD